jgi:hypothetical protein
LTRQAQVAFVAEEGAGLAGIESVMPILAGGFMLMDLCDDLGVLLVLNLLLQFVGHPTLVSRELLLATTQQGLFDGLDAPQTAGLLQVLLATFAKRPGLHGLFDSSFLLVFLGGSQTRLLSLAVVLARFSAVSAPTLRQ